MREAVKSLGIMLLVFGVLFIFSSLWKINSEVTFGLMSFIGGALILWIAYSPED